MTFGSSGTGTDNSIPKLRERGGMEKDHSQSSGLGIRGFIPGNGREREFLIPGFPALLKFRYSELCTVLSTIQRSTFALPMLYIFERLSKD